MAHKFVPIRADLPQGVTPPVICRNCLKVYGTMPAGVLDQQDNGDILARNAIVIDPLDLFQVVYQAPRQAPRKATPILEPA